MSDDISPIIEDVDDPDELSKSVCINIPPTEASIEALEERIQILVAEQQRAHVAECHGLKERVEALESPLKTSESVANSLVTAAARTAEAAEAAAAAATKAAAIMSAAEAVLATLSDHQSVQDLLEGCCISAAQGIQAEIRATIDESRENVRELSRDMASARDP